MMGKSRHLILTGLAVATFILALDAGSQSKALDAEMTVSRRKDLKNRWLDFFGTKKRCTCSFYVLDEGSRPKTRIHSFETVKTRRMLHCSDTVEQLCTSTCFSHAMRFLRSTPCLASFFCSQLGTVPWATQVGLVIWSPQCFPARLVWRTKYKLTCEKGSYISS